MIIFESRTGKFIKFIIRTHNFHTSLITLPNRHCRSKETITRQIPIWRRFDIFLETTMLQIFWEPINFFIFRNQHGFRIRHIEEPTWKCPVNNALLRAWIEWIFVLNIFNTINNPLFEQHLSNNFIRRPKFNAILIGLAYTEVHQPFFSCLHIIALFIQKIHKVHFVCQSQIIVHLAISWSDMHDARTIFIRNIFCSQYVISVFLTFLTREILHQRLIFQAH